MQPIVRTYSGKKDIDAYTRQVSPRILTTTIYLPVLHQIMTTGKPAYIIRQFL